MDSAGSVFIAVIVDLYKTGLGVEKAGANRFSSAALKGFSLQSAMQVSRWRRS